MGEIPPPLSRERELREKKKRKKPGLFAVPISRISRGKGERERGRARRERDGGEWERFLLLSLEKEKIKREEKKKETRFLPSRFPEFRVEKEREREGEGGGRETVESIGGRDRRGQPSPVLAPPPLPTPPYVVVVNNVRFDVNLPVSIESNERAAERRGGEREQR